MAGEKVWVLTADAVTDVAGEMLSLGRVVGVYSSQELAELTLAEVEETYYHKRRDLHN